MGALSRKPSVTPVPRRAMSRGVEKVAVDVDTTGNIHIPPDLVARIALHLTVVTSTTAQSETEVLATAGRDASAASIEVVGHETTAVPVHSSNDP